MREFLKSLPLINNRFAWCVSFAFLLQFILLSPSVAAQLGTLYAFGDSGIDTGNIFVATSYATPNPALGYWEGRFCNGPNYLDQMADAHAEWESVAALLQGTNWSFGGAESGPGNSEKYDVPNLQEQIGLFIADNPGHTFSRQDVILISTGHNDLLSHMSSPPDTSTIAQYVIESVAILQSMGASFFIIPTTVPVHLSPGVRDSADITPAEARVWFVAFNSELNARLASLQEESPGLTIVRTDIFSKLETAYNTPSDYGLTNVTGKSYNGLGTPASYFWFDEAHVTSHMSSFIAQWILSDFNEAYGQRSVSGMSRIQFAFLLCMVLGIGMVVISRKAKEKQEL